MAAFAVRNERRKCVGHGEPESNASRNDGSEDDDLAMTGEYAVLVMTRTIK